MVQTLSADGCWQLLVTMCRIETEPTVESRLLGRGLLLWQRHHSSLSRKEDRNFGYDTTTGVSVAADREVICGNSEFAEFVFESWLFREIFPV